MTIAQRVVDTMLEGTVSGSLADVEAIEQILLGPGNIAAMNKALEPYGVVIEEVPELEQSGSAGGYDGNRMVISPTRLPLLRSHPDYLNTLITHELVHKAQADRIRRAGKDPVGIMTDIALKYGTDKGRNLDVNAYTEEPVEAMALARNAIDKWRRQGYSQAEINQMLAAGQARHASPVPIKSKGKRFHKYAYQYANPESGE